MGPLKTLYWLFVRGYLLHTHQLQVMRPPGKSPGRSPGRGSGETSGGDSLALFPYVAGLK